MYKADRWYRGIILDTEKTRMLIKLYFELLKHVKSILLLLFFGRKIHIGNNFIT